MPQIQLYEKKKQQQKPTFKYIDFPSDNCLSSVRCGDLLQSHMIDSADNFTLWLYFLVFIFILFPQKLSQLNLKVSRKASEM